MLKFANIVRSLYLGDPAELPSLSDIFNNNRSSEIVQKNCKKMMAALEKKIHQKTQSQLCIMRHHGPYLFNYITWISHVFKR
jgi:hypothetical protein